MKTTGMKLHELTLAVSFETKSFLSPSLRYGRAFIRRAYARGFLLDRIKAAGIVAFIALIVRFLLGGNEDTWLCVNGSWVRHGNPAGAPPTTPCSQYP